jgi:hypothetical protein
MPAKRAIAKAERPMTKAQACKVLGVATTADPEIIVQAYWHLARKYRSTASRNARARQRLDELTRAFLVLQPGGRTDPPPPEPPPVVIEQPPAPTPAVAPPTAPEPTPIAASPTPIGPQASTATEAPLLTELVAWVRDVVRQTKARWRGRVPEIAILTATTTVLGYQALSSSGGGLITVLTLGAAGLAIWAPWRQA